MLERRLSSTEHAQNMAWGIIIMADWNNQSDEWRKAARNWQENVYVQAELPLNYTPGTKPSNAVEQPKSLPEALKLIAELRSENHQINSRMDRLDKELSVLENAIEEIESKYHEAVRIARTIHQN
jgi:predicted RNase H-like nuclease (RuvC/YqgF family)